VPARLPSTSTVWPAPAGAPAAILISQGPWVRW
jgi:hypothetical protein